MTTANFLPGWCLASVLITVGTANVACPQSREGGPVLISTIGDFLQHLAWSPAGKQFLFTRIHKGKMGLWTMNVDGSELKPLLPKETMPHFDGHWSPDSKKILFIYDRLEGTDGKLQIDVVNADGTEHKNLIEIGRASCRGRVEIMGDDG